jgi:hypothetical protein
VRILAALCFAVSVAACNGSPCNTVETQIGDVCEPAAVAANVQSVVDVRESCGTTCAQRPSCTAILLSGSLYLTLREDQCSDTVQACIASPCNHNVVSCTIPALGVGDYPVVVSGGLGSVLHVREGGVSGCHLPQPPADAGT